MYLFYVRHGDPIYNPDSLTDLGKEQAQALVKRMKECNPDKIFASSSNRAIMTATPTAQYLNKEIQILDWCNESYAWNELTCDLEGGGKTWYFCENKYKKLFNSEEVRKLGKNWYDHPAFENTLLKTGTHRIQTEVDKFMLSLGYKHDHKNNGYQAIKPNDQRVALFAHLGFGLMFLSCLLDIPYPLLSTHFSLSHSNMTVIEFHGNDFVIPRALQVSNDSHLFASNIATNYENYVYF